MDFIMQYNLTTIKEKSKKNLAPTLKNMYDRRIDLVVPWIAFLALAITGIWLIAKNGGWWKTAVPQDIMPNPGLYYIIWILFLIIFPFLWTMSILTCSTPTQRIIVHLLFIIITIFLLLWVIYLYSVKDIKKALAFISVAWWALLILVIYLWFVQTSSRGSPTTGMALVFLIWLTLVWTLTMTAREEGLRSMFDTMKERFLARKMETDE
jgi:hypothetical protein